MGMSVSEIYGTCKSKTHMLNSEMILLNQKIDK